MNKLKETAFRIKVRKALNQEPREFIVITKEECEKILARRPKK